MQMSENWFVDAPWAQLLCSTKIPDDTLQRFIAMSDKVLDEADGLGNTSVIPSSWEISPEKFQEHDVLSYTMEMVSKYMNTMLSNGNVKQNMDNVISDGPHTQWNSRIITAWIVSQKEDDYLPVHAHNQVTGDNLFNISIGKNSTHVIIYFLHCIVKNTKLLKSLNRNFP